MADRRILVLNGSPRQDGNTMALADLFVREMGWPADVRQLYDEGIAPCRGCLACAKGGDCPLTDDMKELTQQVAAADCIALASPLHFTSLTAPLVAFISRLQPLWHAGMGRTGGGVPGGGKRCGVLLVTGGAEYAGMFGPARSVAAAAFRVLGAAFVGMATAAGTDMVQVADNQAALAEVRLVAERVCSWADGL